MQRIWVLCTRCGSSMNHAYLGAKSIGTGDVCPKCGFSWKDSEIIASTVGDTASEIFGDFRVEDVTSDVKVIWLVA